MEAEGCKQECSIKQDRNHILFQDPASEMTQSFPSYPTDPSSLKPTWIQREGIKPLHWKLFKNFGAVFVISNTWPIKSCIIWLLLPLDSLLFLLIIQVILLAFLLFLNPKRSSISDLRVLLLPLPSKLFLYAYILFTSCLHLGLCSNVHLLKEAFHTSTCLSPCFIFLHNIYHSLTLF